MKIGLFTPCLPGLTLEEVAEWAAAHGFDALEVAAWPPAGGSDLTVSHLDAANLTAAGVERVTTLFERLGLELSSLGYYANNLHPDPATRRAVHDHVHTLIDAAGALGCPTVGTFIGRDPGRTVAENLRDAQALFPPLVQHAGERGVKLIIENCVMESWHPDGYPGNLAYSPELWEWMFSLGLYLNFDPSHLVWLGIDPVEAVRPYIGRIPHVQAKDTQRDLRSRNRYGFYGKALRDGSSESGWWRYRMPGLGDVDWRQLVDVLYEGGFRGVVSVEHEDPVWSGDDDRI